jgi:hypothetical protein
MRVSRGFWMTFGVLLAMVLALTASALAYDLSGTVGNGTAKSGRIYLTVQSSNGGSTGLGVSIPVPGPYTIRGVPSGSYTVQAFMDTQLPEAGIHHASDPAGLSPTVTVNNANASGADLSLSDPPTPKLQSPPSAQGMAGNGMAFVMWDPPFDGNRAELTRSYTVYWSSSPNPGPGNYQGKSPELLSARQSGYLVNGLSNGSSFYFSVTARLASGAAESAPTNVNGGEPLTIGPASGGYKISGTVDSTGIAKSSTTPLWVAAVVPNKAPVAFAYIPAPADLQAFSISGLPPGSYQLYAILDMNNDGVIDAGDFMTPDDQATTVNVGSADVTGANFSLSKQPAGVSVSSNHWMDGSGSGYSLNFQAKGVNKLPVNVAVTGPQLPGYLDMAVNQQGGGSFSSWTSVPNRPQLSPADSYSFTLAYADGSSSGSTPLTAQLMGVIDSTATPLTPTGNISSATPTFTWGAPSNPPSSPYFYSVSVDGNNSHWDSQQLPGSELSAVYGFDGGAPALLPGMPYSWRVNLSDSHGDSAGSASASFTLNSVPGTASGTYGYDAGKGLLTLNWGSSSFVCQGPQPGTETKTVATLNATTLSWLEEDGARSLTRSGTAPTLTGTGADLVGTWAMTDSATGNSYSVTFSQDGSVTAGGTIRQCGSAASMFGFSPMSGMPGTQVTITGSNFDPDPSKDLVTFGTAKASVTSASSNQLVVTVPQGAVSGNISVSTGSAPAVQSPSAFTVLASSVSISFSGSVTDTAGNPVVGATAQVVGNPAISASSAADGSFTLNGIPAGTPFSVEISSNGHLPIYTNQISSSTAVTSSSSFTAYLPAEAAGMGIASGTGGIKAKVVDGSQTPGYLSGAVVTATSQLHPNSPYTVTYFDGATWGGSSTFANGIYLVLNVDDGDTVTVSAGKSGYSFAPRTFHTHADAVSEARIVGTAVTGAGSTISGHLYDANGKGVCGGNISVSGPGGSSFWTTGTDGSYTLTLPTGSYSVSLNYYPANSNCTTKYPAYSTPGVPVTVSGAVVQDFSLPQVFTVSGKVVDGSGGAVSGAGINFSTGTTTSGTTAGSTAPNLYASSSTASDGSYSVGLYGGSYSVSISEMGQFMNAETALLVNGNLTRNYTWKAPAVINGFSPTSGGVGTQVTITGSGFGSPATANSVYFNGTPAQIASWSDSQIVTSVPSGAMSGSISVSVQGMTSWSSTPFSVPILPPKVSWTLPGSNASGMPVKGGIFAGFDSQMDFSSLNNQSFTLQDSTGASVAGSVQAGQDAIVFIPSTPLALGQQYTATLSTGVKGMNGAALASSYSWSFGTESASSNSFTLDGGISSLDSTHDNGVNNYLYDVIRFATDNAHLTDSWYAFQSANKQWVATTASQQMNQYYGLTDSGWQLTSDGPSAGVVTPNSDGSFTWSNGSDGSAQLMEPVEYKLSGEPLASYANPKDLPAPPEGSYPAGSLAYLFRETTVNDSYRLSVWVKEPGTQDQNYLRYNDSNNQQQNVTALTDVPTIFATGQKNNFLSGPTGNFGMQLGQDGTVQLLQFGPQGTTPIPATGSWQYQTVKGQQLIMVHLPQGYQGGDGDLFYAALNGVVKQGALRAAGTLKIDSHPNYNQTAFNWMIGAAVAATAPGAPSVLNVKAGNTQATISFSAPASNGGSAITRFTVTSNPGNITVSGATSPITVIGLTNGASYTFTVTASNAAGSSSPSAASSAVTPAGDLPGAPMMVTASAGNAGATVNFIPPVSNGGSAITGYTVTSTPAGAVDTNAGTTATTHLISGLSNGTSYSFTVTATNATGTGAASPPSNSVTPATLPGAPAGVAASADHGQAQVSFGAPGTDGGSAIIGYTVTSTPGGISASGKGSPITVTGLSDGTSYTFTVTATSKAGTGAPSAPSNAVTPADSTPPVVRSFSLPGSVGALESSRGNALPVTSFIATDNAAVTGYLVTTSSAKPGADAAGWSAGPPTSCQIDSTPGVHTVYAWAKDAAGNVSAPYSATVVVTPVDTTAPVILAGPIVTSLGNNSAVVEWQTDEAALGGVKYGDSPAPVGGSNESAYQTRHAVTLSGLTPDTTYYLSVFAVDHAGNGPTLSKQITLHTKPAPDSTAPFIIEGPTVLAIGPDMATIQWRTDKPARGEVSYGSADTLGDSAAETGFSTTHSVRVTGLSAQTQYYFKISATDAAGNGPRESGMGSFTTVALPDTTAPVVVEGPMVVNISNSGATVLWKTDEPATSTVISFDGANYGFFSDSTLSTSHSVTLTGLQGSKQYSYKVSSTDASGNTMTLGSFKSFSTLAAPDTTPPAIIQGPLLVAVDYQSAAIRWDTDEPSDSVIEYGTSDSFGSSSSQSDLQRSHNLTLTGLQSGTVYYFRVLSTDAFGNGPTASRGFSFTTPQNPSYKVPVITVAPTIIYKTDTSMTVYWETDDPSDSVVKYGAGDQLTQRVSSSDKVNKHQITITNLQKSTSYKVVVSSTNMSGNTVYAKQGGAARRLAYNLDSVYSDASGGVSFLGTVTTEAQPDTTAPVITVAPVVAGVADHQATITWTTDKISDSQVVYGPQGGALALSAGDPTQVTSHIVVLTNLTAGSQYQFQVSSTDPSGNGPTTSSVASFTTAATPDTTPPAFQGNPALVVSYQDGTGKTTVGWSTDKLATTQINYGTSSTAMTSQAALPGLATAHSLTLALQPGTTYFAAAVAIDSSGNVSASAPLQFTTMGSADLTPPSTSTTPTAGSYVGDQSVTLSTDKPATIYYTTDGSTPTTSSAQYNGPIAVTSSKSIRFFAIDAAGNQEAPHAADFVIQHAVTSSSDLNGAISCPSAVNSGETALCTVTANTGYKAGSVTGCGGTLNGTTFTTGVISADCSVAASFTPITFSVTPAVTGSGSIAPATVQTVSYGSSSSFTLTPAAGYQVASVNGCGGTLSGNTYSTGLLSGDCTVSATFTPTDTPSVLLGDLTGDGQVDVADAMRALQISVGLITPTSWDLSHGDVGPLVEGKTHADGKIDISDVMLILKKSVGLANW